MFSQRSAINTKLPLCLQAEIPGRTTTQHGYSKWCLRARGYCDGGADAGFHRFNEARNKN